MILLFIVLSLLLLGGAAALWLSGYLLGRGQPIAGTGQPDPRLVARVAELEAALRHTAEPAHEPRHLPPPPPPLPPSPPHAAQHLDRAISDLDLRAVVQHTAEAVPARTLPASPVYQTLASAAGAVRDGVESERKAKERGEETMEIDLD